MEDVEDNQAEDFHGFNMNDAKISDETSEREKVESKEEKMDTLPNGTEEKEELKENSNENDIEMREELETDKESLIKKDEMIAEDDEEEEDEEEDDDDDEEEEEEEEEEADKDEDKENKELKESEDEDSKSAEPARKRLRSISGDTQQSQQSEKEPSKADVEPEEEPEPEPEPEAEAEAPEEEVKPVAEGYRSSDEEDFYGFDVPAPSIKGEVMRALMGEAENQENDPITPITKGQGRGGPRTSKKAMNVDLSNPEYKKPFEYGWVRELVYRSTSDTALRRNADIYYFTPKGKKVRSFREVAEHLSGDLTVDNFTFFKGPIGINDPEKEIIREAKAKPYSNKGEDGFSPIPIKKATPKLKATLTPKGTPPKGVTDSSSGGKGGFTPRVVFKGNITPKNKGTVSVKSKLSMKGEKKRKSAGPDDEEIDSLSPGSWSPDQKANPARDVCSIECRLAMGLIPTLQCHVCLCLYHPECVGIKEALHRPIYSYVCKTCQLVKSSAANKASLPPPPPLTPIISNSSPPKASPPPKRDGKAVVVASRSIVGAVTTWLPPSSSVQVSMALTTAKTTPVISAAVAAPPCDGPPQSLVSLNGKQYVVVPKHNVVNISNQATVVMGGAGMAIAAADSGVETEDISCPPTGVLLVPCPQAAPIISPTASHTDFVIGNISHGATLLSTATIQANGVKRSSNSPVEAAPPPVEKKPKLKETPVQNATPGTHPVMQNFMMNLNAGFLALLHAFQYLKVHELLRASCVSHMWKHVASHSSLWGTVRMKNSRVRDWEGFGRTLSSSGTRNLDLKKMLLPDTPEATVEMWNELTKAIAKVTSLRRIDLGRCTPEAVESVASSCPQLESITSLAVRGGELDMTPISTCTNLTELRLKTIGGIDVKNLTSLKSLTELKHLSLTTVKNLAGIEEVLSEKLESLELGECATLSEEAATEALGRLTSLRRLRLEKGQGSTCPVTSLLTTVASLPALTQLELINFDVKPGFDKALAKCSNLKTLLIIPTYVTQSATTNHVVMGGVSKLSSTLTYFVWGLTLELLRVTDLFIDQVEGQKGKAQAPGPKKGTGDSIPILKPMVEDGAGGNGGEGANSASQVDILALPKLQKVLSTLLPTTKIKILKVPFSATWRQTVSEVPQ